MNYVDRNIIVYAFVAHEYILPLSTCRGVKLMSHRECINTDLAHISQSISNVSTHQQWLRVPGAPTHVNADSVLF